MEKIEIDNNTSAEIGENEFINNYYPIPILRLKSNSLFINSKLLKLVSKWFDKLFKYEFYNLFDFNDAFYFIIFVLLNLLIKLWLRL